MTTLDYYSEVTGIQFTNPEAHILERLGIKILK
jgi:hypothetical protein